FSTDAEPMGRRFLFVVTVVMYTIYDVKESMLKNRRIDGPNGYDSVVLVSMPEENEDRPAYMAISHRNISDPEDKIYAYVCVNLETPASLKSAKELISQKWSAALQKKKVLNGDTEKNGLSIQFSPFPAASSKK
ncbi:MAG: hypothetical protein PF495_21270, partial [Spirochaetales bacterium]|nr:hypothetical protein [Spirochaetales bacterium]